MIEYNYSYILYANFSLVGRKENMQYNKSKTLGKKSALLLSLLQERGWTIFDVSKAHQLLDCKAKEAADLVDKMITRGLVTRIKNGLYQLVPFELGRESIYIGDSLIIMSELIANITHSNDQYFISHGSAMEFHQMVTQPQFKVYATVPRFIKNREIYGTEYRFITVKSQHFFGLKKEWLTKVRSIYVSDIERTILDGLRQPDYCGGITEVAKAMWIKKSEINPTKLIDYAIKLDSGAVYRRLGFLCSLYQICSEESLRPLKERLTASYQLLDPTFPKEGPHKSSWKIQLNISEEELLTLRNT